MKAEVGDASGSLFIWEGEVLLNGKGKITAPLN